LKNNREMKVDDLVSLPKKLSTFQKIQTHTISTAIYTLNSERVILSLILIVESSWITSDSKGGILLSFD